jgi:hypothetical protein
MRPGARGFSTRTRGAFKGGPSDFEMPTDPIYRLVGAIPQRQADREVYQVLGKHERGLDQPSIGNRDVDGAAFSPEDAKRIADAVVKLSENLINDLNERMRRDTVLASETDLRRTEMTTPIKEEVIAAVQAEIAPSTQGMTRIKPVALIALRRLIRKRGVSPQDQERLFWLVESVWQAIKRGDDPGRAYYAAIASARTERQNSPRRRPTLVPMLLEQPQTPRAPGDAARYNASGCG